ncbi:unnamed protein product [Cuscuta campestris]|uniref:Transmembrane protein n=1 Tax=Cuscuta campestris TaxID=132261 RepID=A0A484M928_9ASTE|nr:unnamed protein product [Cuscuta campestris]
MYESSFEGMISDDVLQMFEISSMIACKSSLSEGEVVRDLVWLVSVGVGSAVVLVGVWNSGILGLGWISVWIWGFSVEVVLGVV